VTKGNDEMENSFFIMLTTLFGAVSSALLHRTLGQKWKRNEFARRALGWGVVLLPTALLAAAGVFDWVTWLGVFFTAAGAGAALFFLHTITEENKVENRVMQLRKEIFDGAIVEPYPGTSRKSDSSTE
jgi:hypothetical protein